MLCLLSLLLQANLPSPVRGMQVLLGKRDAIFFAEVAASTPQRESLVLPSGIVKADGDARRPGLQSQHSRAVLQGKRIAPLLALGLSVIMPKFALRASDRIDYEFISSVSADTGGLHFLQPCTGDACRLLQCPGAV